MLRQGELSKFRAIFCFCFFLHLLPEWAGVTAFESLSVVCLFGLLALKLKHLPLMRRGYKSLLAEINAW